jgi:hypothetical protein
VVYSSKHDNYEVLEILDVTTKTVFICVQLVG